MNPNPPSETGHGTAGAEHHQTPKWAAVVNDRLLPMPRRNLSARTILEQAGAEPDVILVRDHENQQDFPLKDDEMVDLAAGNVFKLVDRCLAIQTPTGTAAPKLAFVCDDAWEQTLIGLQTEPSLKRLLGIDGDMQLLRDFESQNDSPIGPQDHIRFEEGPVFRSIPQDCQEPCGEIKIIVNGREKSVTAKQLSYAEVVRLAFENADPETIYTVTFKKGSPPKPEGSMVQGDVVKILCGMIFNVTATRKS